MTEDGEQEPTTAEGPLSGSGPDVTATAASAATAGERAVRRAAVVRRVVARAATGGIALAAVAGVVVLGAQVPVAPPVAAPAASVPVPASGSTLVCPGPVRLPTEPEPGEDVSYDPEFDPAPSASLAELRAITVDGSSGRLRALDTSATDVTALEPGAGVTVPDLGTTLVLEADPTPEGPAQAAGTLGVTTTQGDLRGLVAGACQRPSSESWLVGGSTQLGSSARLVLQNPGRTAVTAAVTLWGPAGQVELSGAPTFLVPAGTERVVLLEGVAADQRRVAVRLQASGGLLTGYVQDSSLRGLVPTGVDLVMAGQAPARQQVVPGLLLPDAEIGDPDAAQLRLLAPGGPATVSVQLLGPDGPVDLPGAGDLALEEGAVVDVPLAGVPAGNYTAVVTADTPVVAGAVLTRQDAEGGADAPVERAWVASTVPGPGTVALPPATWAWLLVSTLPGQESQAAAEVTLEGFDAQGTSLGTWPVEIAAGATERVHLGELMRPAADEAELGEPPAAISVRTDDERIAWAVVAAVDRPDGPLISVVTPVAPEPAPDHVAVRVR